MLRSLCPSILLPLLACSPPLDPVVTISGSLSRTESGAWSGVEERELVDEVGTCRVVEELEAEDAEASACDGCTLALHVTHATERPEASACDSDLEEAPGAPQNYAFRPGDGDEGEVMVADALEGPWTLWSFGTLGDGVLTWQHDAEPNRDPAITLDDLRPKHDQPPRAGK